MKNHLRGQNEFQKVYRGGKRYDGSLISVFVLPNDQIGHRIGITASRKAVGNAVERNRAKRLLRESFSLSKASLENLKNTYDWVLNAKRRLTGQKLKAAFDEFEDIIQRVAREENPASLACCTA